MTSIVDGRAVAISLFLIFVAGCLFVSMLTSPDLQDREDDFFTEHSRPWPLRQGFALTGDLISAAGVLYLCGIVAVGSYDGILILTATALSPLL
ncbi:MAG TPA: cation acetate symporter, partial [Streptomyces sp.]|nr:cation acetate symporter [Streptomyces sp.]